MNNIDNFKVLMNQNNISITLHWEETKRTAQYPLIVDNRFGIEIISFSHYSIWESNFKSIISKYKKELHNFTNNYISFHGPINEILPHSEVSAISRFSKQRVEKSIEIALELMAKRIVFHTGINTIITDPSFINNTITKQAIFWSSLCEKYREIEIVIENMWEPSPFYLIEICKLVNKTNFGICLDVGHSNVYSNETTNKWIIDSLPFLKHIHLNDNNGKWDEHLALGNGNINFAEWLNGLRVSPNLQYVIELTEMKDITESLQKLNTITR